MGLLPRSCFLLVVVVLLVPATITQDCNTDICVLSCEGCEANELVPDPFNCRGFYLCDDNETAIDIPLECGAGQVFNATEHKCVQGETCELCPSPPSFCVYECAALDNWLGNISLFTDCNHYYECTDEDTMTPMKCNADNPFFDGGECQTDETKCCSCKPYCPLEDTPQLTADPLDCRKFYICTEPGTVPEFVSSCSDGMYFDSIMNECNDLVSCNTQCTNVVGADGCIEPLTCLETGYFAKCPGRCTPDYYHCTEANGELQDAESCGSGTVFHPDTHNCVTQGSCPYPP